MSKKYFGAITFFEKPIYKHYETYAERLIHWGEVEHWMTIEFNQKSYNLRCQGGSHLQDFNWLSKHLNFQSLIPRSDITTYFSVENIEDTEKILNTLADESKTN